MRSIAGGGARCRAPSDHDAKAGPEVAVEGVTLVEFLIAALLIVTATTMIGSVMGPLDSLRSSMRNDVDAAVLEAAADTVARTLRSVRPSTWHRGVAGSTTALELQVGPADDPAWVLLRFAGDDLTIEHLGPGDVPSSIPVGTILTGLDAQASRFVLRDRSGTDIDPGDPGLALVGLVLARQDRETARLEDLRVVPGGW